MNHKAFTLIELLVVVLIIGILSAIALPQYEKAVLKTRISEVRILFKAVQEGYQLCLLENGCNGNCEACDPREYGEFLNFEAPSNILTGGDCREGGLCFATKYWQYESDDGYRFEAQPLFGTLDVTISGDIDVPNSLSCYEDTSFCKSLGFVNCKNNFCYL